jgi:hypothetical protein
MATSILRFSSTGLPPSLQQQVPGIPVSSAVETFVTDITVDDLYIDDLKSTMEVAGYAYVSTTPTNTPNEALVAAISTPTATPNTIPRADGSGYLAPAWTAIAQVVNVGKAGSVDFDTVGAALSYIAGLGDASISKPYLIRVGPGVYTEAPLSMIPYVGIVGAGMYETQLVTSNNGAHFITGAENCSLAECAITGPTGAGLAAINCTFSGTGPMLVQFVVIRAGYYGIWCHPPTSRGIVHAFSVGNWYAANMENFFRSEVYGNITAISCAFMSGPSAAVVRGYYCSGANAEMTLDQCSFRNTGATDAVYVNDDGNVRCNGMVFGRCVNAIHLGSTGTVTSLHAINCIMTDGAISGWQVLCDSTSSTTSLDFTGYAESAQFSIPSAVPYVAAYASDAGFEVQGEIWSGAGSGAIPIRSSVFLNASTGWLSGGATTYDTHATTLAVSMNGLSLPQGTINVASTTGFPTPSGTIYVTSAGGPQTVTYTGTTGTSFTGCSGGTGVLSTGGLVRTNGRNILVSAGTGQIKTTTGVISVAWPATVVTLTASDTTYIYADTNSAIQTATSLPSFDNTVHLAVGHSNATDVLYLASKYYSIARTAQQTNEWIQFAAGPIWVSGLATTAVGVTLAIDITGGVYYIGLTELATTAQTPASYYYWYEYPAGTWNTIGPGVVQTVINATQYNDPTDVGNAGLTPLGATNKWKKDGVWVCTHDGVTQVHVVYGQTAYNTQADAEASTIPSPPPWFREAALPVAGIVVYKNDTFITTIVDELPTLGGAGGGGGGGGAFDGSPYFLLSGNAARNPVTGTGNFAGGAIVLPVAAGGVAAATAVGTTVYDSTADTLTVSDGALPVVLMRNGQSATGGNISGTYPTNLSVVPAGTAYCVQFNSSPAGTLSGDSLFTWDAVSDTLKLGTATVLPRNPLAMYGDTSTGTPDVNYLQMNIQNGSSSTLASSDLIMTSNDGTDTTYYQDIGVCSSTYADPLSTVWMAHDGYVYVEGGNEVIGTLTAGKTVKFFTGGSLAANIRVSVVDTGLDIASALSLKFGGTALFTAGSLAVDLLATADNTRAIGSAALRMTSFNASTGYFVYGAASDANPTAKLASNDLSFGAGGATAVDVTLSRGAADRLDLASGDSLNLVAGNLMYAGANITTSGVLSSDTVHGVRGGGTQHADATTGVSGFMSAADKTKLNGVVAEANPAVLTWGNTGVGTSTTARYLTPGFERALANTASTPIIVPSAGVIRNLVVAHITAGTGAATITYTVLKNGVGTTLTVDVSNTSTTFVKDSTDSFTVAAGDKITLRVTKSVATTTSPTTVVASFELSPA